MQRNNRRCGDMILEVTIPSLCHINYKVCTQRLLDDLKKHANALYTMTTLDVNNISCNLGHNVSIIY